MFKRIPFFFFAFRVYVNIYYDWKSRLSPHDCLFKKNISKVISFLRYADGHTDDYGT